MIHKRFEELNHCGNLPSPSGVGLAILHLTRSEHVAFADLVRALQVDPALTGRVLRLANSVLVDGAAPVTSVQEAAVRLGTSGMRNVALGFTLVASNRSGMCARFDYERFWSWSLACACAAQVAAQDTGLVDPSGAFTCALVSRIGMLALASVRSETYARVLDEARERSPEYLLQIESRAFDIQHWEVAAAMFADWGLPEAYSAAVMSLGHGARETVSDDAGAGALAQILRDASQAATQLVGLVESDARGLGAEWMQLLAPVGGALMSGDRLNSLAARASRTWGEWGALFQIPTAQVAATDVACGADSERTSARETEEVRTGIEPLRADEIQILAIDDDPRVLRLLCHHLERAGYRVRTAKDGHEGLQAVIEFAPHIVLTDWLMPGLSGIELVEALRRTESGRNTYVLLLTARNDEQQIVDAFASGADDYITKPFNPRILLARVQAGQRVIDLRRQVDSDKQLRMRQVAEMGLLTRKLHSAALTDVLTELPNRRYAMARLEQEWTDSVRLDRPLSVSIVDVDHFKLINDQHGHDAGDAVLKATALLLRARTRRGDVVCRIGGEEFLVINVQCDAPSALVCAERLRSSVHENTVKSGTFDGSVTVSIGTATRQPAMKCADDLLKAADEAVYSAKAAGRNNVWSRARRLPETG